MIAHMIFDRCEADPNCTAIDPKRKAATKTTAR